VSVSEGSHEKPCDRGPVRALVKTMMSTHSSLDVSEGSPMKAGRTRNDSESSHENRKVVSLDPTMDVKAQVEPDGQCAV
jgi:hypothetical protein